MKTVNQGFLGLQEYRLLFLCQDHLEQFLVSKDKRYREQKVLAWERQKISLEQKIFSYTNVGFLSPPLLVQNKYNHLLITTQSHCPGMGGFTPSFLYQLIILSIYKSVCSSYGCKGSRLSLCLLLFPFIAAFQFTNC